MAPPRDRHGSSRSLRTLGALARPHLGTLLVSMLLLALHALTTGAYAYLAGPVLKLVYSGGDTAGLRMSWLLERLGLLAGGGAVGLTTAIAVVVVAVVILKGLAYFGGSYLVVLAGQRMEHELRSRLHDHLLRVTWGRLADLPRGDMVARFLADVAAVKFAVTHGLANIVRDLLQIVVLAVLAVWLDPLLGALALLVLPLSTLVILKLGSRLRGRRRKASDAYGELASEVEQTAAALPVLRAFGAGEHARRRFDSLSERILRRNLRAWALQIFSSPLMELLGAAALAGTLWYAGARIGTGRLEPESFVSFFAAVFLLYRPVKAIGDSSSQLYAGLASLDRVEEILALPVEPEDEPGAPDLEGIGEAIRFEQVSYGYGAEAVLDRASFEVPAGQTVALVGPSGSGKTTAAMLLLRMDDPWSGRITIDGKDIRAVSRRSVRRLFGLVTQDPVLLNDTVEENIRLGHEGAREALEAAARAAGAHRFVSALPSGYAAGVGEAGGRLSGGERQRICIARALLRDPPALVLDEATASVDSATEAEITVALAGLAEGRTTLLVAHRLSTVRRADRVVVLEAGRVVAQGAYEELVASSPELRRVFCDQLPEEPGRS